MEVPILAAVVAFVLVVVLVILYLSIRVVQQYEKMVVFRLGRTNESMVRDPGLRFLIPIIDRPVKVDVREQFIEVPSQTTITKDNAPINVDFLIYWRIADPLKSVVNVANFPGALQGVATTTLRAVIGDILLDEVLSQARADQRGPAGQARRGDRALGRQGHDRRDPRDHAAARRPGRDEPPALRRADAARRDHRVRGHPAGGDQRRRGPEAGRDPQGRGRPPGGDPAGRGVRRGADADLPGRHGVDQKTMSLQYLEALKALGAGPATKFVIPMEFTRLLEPFVDFLTPTDGGGGTGGRPAAPCGPAPAGPEA